MENHYRTEKGEGTQLEPGSELNVRAETLETEIFLGGNFDWSRSVPTRTRRGDLQAGTTMLQGESRHPGPALRGWRPAPQVTSQSLLEEDVARGA